MSNAAIKRFNKHFEVAGQDDCWAGRVNHKRRVQGVQPQ